MFCYFLTEIFTNPIFEFLAESLVKFWCDAEIWLKSCGFKTLKSKLALLPELPIYGVNFRLDSWIQWCLSLVWHVSRIQKSHSIWTVGSFKNSKKLLHMLPLLKLDDVLYKNLKNNQIPKFFYWKNSPSAIFPNDTKITTMIQIIGGSKVVTLILFCCFTLWKQWAKKIENTFR